MILTNGNKTRQLNKSGKKTKQTKSDKKTYPISWQQMGDDINGEAEYNESGRSVSLASDGDTVAIGAYRNNGNGTLSGHTRVYKWNSSNSTWLQIGVDLDGEAKDDLSGLSVSLASDGDTVAIGASYNNGNGTYSGHVRVYSVCAV